ncbi:MAG: nucleotide exchange factor GrpE [Candidatus Polarisedimenticolia bacterium]
MSDRTEHEGRGENGREAPFRVVDRRPRFDDPPPPGETAPEPETRYPTVVEELRGRLEEAERRAGEAEGRTREISAAYRRIEDERDAFRERLQRDLDRRVEIARAGFLLKIVDILDDFDRAIAAARVSEHASALLDGVILIRDRVLQALGSEGVERLVTEGRPFDPAIAEAVATEPVDDPARDGLVVEELARGYAIKGSLLRPARVRVARVPAGPGSQEPPEGAAP